MRRSTFVILPLVMAVACSALAQDAGNDPLSKLKAMWSAAREKATEPLDSRYREELAKLSTQYENQGYPAGSAAVAAELELIKKISDPNSVEDIDRTLTIVEAKFGSAEQYAEEKEHDVTEKAQKQVVDDELSIEKLRDVFGDPHPFKGKLLKITYWIGDKEFETECDESTSLKLPKGNEDLSEDPIPVTDDVRKLRGVWIAARVRSTDPIDQTFERELKKMHGLAQSKRDEDLADQVMNELEGLAETKASSVAIPREKFDIEGEDMAFEKGDRESISYLADHALASQMSGEKHLLWSAEKKGNEVQLSFQVPADGEYDIEGRFLVGPEGGKVSLKLDGNLIGEDIDFYALDPDLESRKLGRVRLREGAVRLEITQEEKNSDSEGMQIGLDYLRLFKVEFVQ